MSREREQYYLFHFNDSKIKIARMNVQYMKENLPYGNHYQLDPKAVGFYGMHVERSKTKVFARVSFQVICSCLRNLRANNEKQPYKSNIPFLSNYILILLEK